MKYASGLIIIWLAAAFLSGCSGGGETVRAGYTGEDGSRHEKSSLYFLDEWNMEEQYKKFLQGETVAAAVSDRETVLSFYEEETYWEIEETVFPKEILKKYFTLMDINGDKEKELVFRITAGADELLCILGCIDGELMAYDVFETHTPHMSFSIWDNGILWWGQNHTGEEVAYFQYGRDGAKEELLHFVSTPKWQETARTAQEYPYEYYYEAGQEGKKVYLQSAAEYEALISKYQGGQPQWHDLSDFCDVSVLRPR